MRMVNLVLTSLPNFNGYTLQAGYGALDGMLECNFGSTERFVSFPIADASQPPSLF